MILSFPAKPIEPPRLRLDPARQVVSPGENAVIDCLATGQQPITMEWRSERGQLPPTVTVQGGRLTFRGIAVSDQGKYFCQASNTAGNASAVAEVIVQGTQIVD